MLPRKVRPMAAVPCSYPGGKRSSANFSGMKPPNIAPAMVVNCSVSECAWPSGGRGGGAWGWVGRGAERTDGLDQLEERVVIRRKRVRHDDFQTEIVAEGIGWSSKSEGQQHFGRETDACRQGGDDVGKTTKPPKS